MNLQTHRQTANYNWYVTHCRTLVISSGATSKAAPQSRLYVNTDKHPNGSYMRCRQRKTNHMPLVIWACANGYRNMRPVNYMYLFFIFAVKPTDDIACRNRIKRLIQHSNCKLTYGTLNTFREIVDSLVTKLITGPRLRQRSRWKSQTHNNPFLAHTSVFFKIGNVILCMRPLATWNIISTPNAKVFSGFPELKDSLAPSDICHNNVTSKSTNTVAFRHMLSSGLYTWQKPSSSILDLNTSQWDVNIWLHWFKYQLITIHYQLKL